MHVESPCRRLPTIHVSECTEIRFAETWLKNVCDLRKWLCSLHYWRPYKLFRTCTGCKNAVTRLICVGNWWSTRSNLSFWLANVTGFWGVSLVLSGDYVYSTLTAVSCASLFHCGKFYMYTCSFECDGNVSWIVIGKDLARGGCDLPWPRQLKLGLIFCCCQTDATYLRFTYWGNMKQ